MSKKFNQKDFGLVATDVKEINDMLLFSQATWNGLYLVDRKTKEVIYNTIFEGEAYASVMLYYSLQIIGSKAVFVPHSARRIAIFDMKSKILDYLDIEEVKADYHENYRDSAKFARCFQYNSFVYMLGYSYPAILKLDIETLKIVYISDWIEDVNKNIINGDIWGYFSDGFIFGNNKVLLPLGCMAGLLELDLITDETRLIYPKISIKRIGGIGLFGQDKLWITARGNDLGKVVRWDIKSDEYLEIELPDCCEKFGSYYSPLQVKGKIYLFPEYIGHIYEIDEETMTAKINKKLDEILQGKQGTKDLAAYVITPYTNGTDITFISGWNYKWHRYNPETNEHYEFFISAEIDRDKYFKEKIELISETKKNLNEFEIGLNNFLDNINQFKKYPQEESFTLGHKIYREMYRSN